jgi:DNA repair exonuclease SbcCD nuclease subunit
MQNISFVHVADLHLGEPIKGWKWGKELVWKRQEEYLQTFERIISFVHDKSIPFLLIAGDFLEHGFVTSSLYQFVMDQFQRIPDTRIFISPGNHDPYREDSVYLQEVWPDHVYIFSGSWETLYFPEYQLHVSGRGFVDFSERESSLPPPICDSARHIYVVHGDYREDKSLYFPILEKELMEHDVDYVALGHIHKRQTYQLKNKRETIIHYPGSPEARNWKETGERYLTFGTIDDRGVELESIPIHTRKYINLEIDITNQQTLAHINESISTNMSKEANDDYVLVRLVGRSYFGSEDRHWLQKLERMLQSEYKWIVLEDETLPEYNLRLLRNQQSLIGTFIHMMEQRIAEETDDKQKRILEMALYRGLDAMEREVVNQ